MFHPPRHVQAQNHPQFKKNRNNTNRDIQLQTVSLNQNNNNNNNNNNQDRQQTADPVRDNLINIAKSNGYFMKTINSPLIPKSIIIDYDQSSIKTNFATNDTRIEFISHKSDKAAIYCMKTGSKKIVVMNFANRFKHGGGYLNGSKAQEEDLCRVIPALYSSLKRLPYPYDPDSVIITPDLTIMRDSDNNYEFMSEQDQINVGIVSAAAQDLKREHFNEILVRKTLVNMYCSVKKHLPDTDTIILGAWGCGAFKNDPIIMSKIMNEINLMYGGYYKRIVFSVPVGDNYFEFKDTILQTEFKRMD